MTIFDAANDNDMQPRSKYADDGLQRKSSSCIAVSHLDSDSASVPTNKQCHEIKEEPHGHRSGRTPWWEETYQELGKIYGTNNLTVDDGSSSMMLMLMQPTVGARR